jgi:hypothetical protein
MPVLSPRLYFAAFAAMAALLTCAFAAEAAGPRPGTGCGGTLWRQMTLSDPQRQQVDMRGMPTTIAQIAALDKPPLLGLQRSSDFQRHVWRLRAVVDRYRIASNGEIVLILFSIDTGLFMNAYLPAEACLGVRARDRSAVLAARRGLTTRCPTVTAAWQLLGATVEIGGVGFWNPVQTTRGALANGAELRPVTSLSIVTGCGVG